MNAFDAAEISGRVSELQSELEALFASQNRAGDSATSIPAAYLQVLVAR